MTVTISVDAMGGDFGVSVTVPACLDILKEYQDCQIILVGEPDLIEAALSSAASELRSRIRVLLATEVVHSDDSIEIALRRKKILQCESLLSRSRIGWPMQSFLLGIREP